MAPVISERKENERPGRERERERRRFYQHRGDCVRCYYHEIERSHPSVRPSSAEKNNETVRRGERGEREKKKKTEGSRCVHSADKKRWPETKMDIDYREDARAAVLYNRNNQLNVSRRRARGTGWQQGRDRTQGRKLISKPGGLRNCGREDGPGYRGPRARQR